MAGRILVLIAAGGVLFGSFFFSSCGAGDNSEPDPRQSAESSREKEPRPVDLRRFAGTELLLIANKHPWIDLIRPHLDKFTELTGIKVQIDIYPEDQFRTKRSVELMSGLSSIDVFMIMPGNSLDEYIREGWIEELNPYMHDPKLTWPEYSFDDIIDTALEVGIRNNKNYTLPIMLETSLLAYNRDILEKYSLPVPDTMEELERVAKAVYEKSEGKIYGITMRGKKSAATSQWIDFVRSFGGDWTDEAGEFALHSAEALTATQFYGRLLRHYGPPSAPNNSWYESTALFMQGQAAMIYDASVFKSNYEDPQMSHIADAVGYSTIPAGPAGSVPHVSSWGLAINPASTNKQPAWYFMQWATSSEFALQGLMKGIPAARQSAWDSPEFKEVEASLEWTRASLESYRYASTRWNPPVIDVGEGREIAGAPIVTAILGDDIFNSAKAASRRLNQLKSKEHAAQK